MEQHGMGMCPKDRGQQRAKLAVQRRQPVPRPAKGSRVGGCVDFEGAKGGKKKHGARSETTVLAMRAW